MMEGARGYEKRLLFNGSIVLVYMVLMANRESGIVIIAKFRLIPLYAGDAAVRTISCDRGYSYRVC